jgi:hypothetical protein
MRQAPLQSFTFLVSPSFLELLYSLKEHDRTDSMQFHVKVLLEQAEQACNGVLALHRHCKHHHAKWDLAVHACTVPCFPAVMHCALLHLPGCHCKWRHMATMQLA